MGNLNEYNAVRSTIIDQGTQLSTISVSKNRLFIFGTAKSGPRHVPVVPNRENIKAIFGEAPLDASFDTSLVRGYYEVSDALIGEQDLALVRVGNVQIAAADFYENTHILSGDLAYTLVDGHPAISMRLEAQIEGAEYNGTKVEIVDDTGSGEFPSVMTITLPNGDSASYNLSKTSGAPNAISRVSDLVNLINANPLFTGKITASYTPIEKDITITITESGGVTTTDYDILSTGSVTGNDSDVSYGDKLVSIVSAYQSDTVSGEIAAGAASAEMEIPFNKSSDLDDGSLTVSKFVRFSNLENFLTVSALNIGAASITKPLYCKQVTGWYSAYDIRGNVTDGWAAVVYVKRNGTSSYAVLESSKYTISQSTGDIVITDTFAVGDRYYASYRYQVSYTEAKRRSDLLTGSDRSYFISGDQIFFGAAQPSDLLIYYLTNIHYDTDDIQISDRVNGIVSFINAATMPEVGSSIIVRIAHEPELPALSGTVLVGSVVQPGALSGGSDGRITDKKSYIKAVVEAMKAVDLYPRRRNIVMGLYLDDTIDGYNEETGLAETVALNGFASLLPYIDRASNLTNECDLAIPVRPTYSLTQSGISAWLTGLTENSSTDITRPANIIDSINNFRAHAPVGVMTVQIADVNNGKPYFANPACIYEAARINNGLKDSMLNKVLPGSVKDIGVKIFNAELIAQLNTKRYTAVVMSYTGSAVWADAPTLAIKYRSQYDRQYVRDVVYEAVGIAREIADPYIGKPRQTQYLYALKKAVAKGLQTMVPDMLSDILGVELIPVADGSITGRTRLRLWLLTAKEIRSIDIETAISLA